MATKVAKTGVTRESGWLYFLDKKGDVSRVPMQRGGGKAKKGRRERVAKAGVERADPLIRYVVDDEFGDIAHKEKSFADTVMFWRDGASSPTPSAPGAEAPAPVDAAAEEQRINEITGGGDVVIRRESSGRIKLPGL